MGKKITIIPFYQLIFGVICSWILKLGRPYKGHWMKKLGILGKNTLIHFIYYLPMENGFVSLMEFYLFIFGYWLPK